MSKTGDSSRWSLWSRDSVLSIGSRGSVLSVGSVGSSDGWTSMLVRSDRGREAVDRARGSLEFRDLDDPAAHQGEGRPEPRTVAQQLG